MIDTPIAEEGFVGAAFGAAWMGERPIVELQFADFVSCPFDAIVTVRRQDALAQRHPHPAGAPAPYGGGVRGGPFHASCPEGWFVGVAGLKVVCPGSVADAYGLLRSAVEDDDPVLFFEHKALYRRLRDERPDDAHRTPIGRARSSRARRDATVVTYGSGVDLALRAAAARAGRRRGARPAHGLAARRATRSSSRRAQTSRARAAGGVALGRGRPRAPLVARDGFELLDAPPLLVAPPDSPVPFAPELEDAYIPSIERVVAELRRLGGY